MVRWLRDPVSAAETSSFLFGFVGMLLGALGAILAMGRVFVTKSYCQQYHIHHDQLRVQETINDAEWRGSINLQSE